MVPDKIWLITNHFFFFFFFFFSFRIKRRANNVFPSDPDSMFVLTFYQVPLLLPVDVS